MTGIWKVTPKCWDMCLDSIITARLADLLKENTDKEVICKHIDFIERMYLPDDDAVKNVVEVTILEYLGDNDQVLKNVFDHYFSLELIEASKKIEALLRRRNINISYRRGKILTRWEC